MGRVINEKGIRGPTGSSVGEAVGWATTLLESSGVDTARLDAECLLASLLGRDRLHVYAAARDALPPPILERYRTLVNRRQAREPLAYLTGTKEFWSLSLTVSPPVLIPRPETETVVEAALTRLEYVRAPVVVDIGTGSGAIAVAIAKTRPDARVFATEISTEALGVARRNASLHRVRRQIVFLHGDLLEPLDGRGLAGRCDMIVSNPPYVETADLKTLPPEVRYEPPGALDGGWDGLAYLRRIITGAHAFLRPGAWVVLEMAPGQGRALTRLLQHQEAFTDIGIIRDLGGRERVITARHTWAKNGT